MSLRGLEKFSAELLSDFKAVHRVQGDGVQRLKTVALQPRRFRV